MKTEENLIEFPAEKAEEVAEKQPEYSGGEPCDYVDELVSGKLELEHLQAQLTAIQSKLDEDTAEDQKQLDEDTKDEREAMQEAIKKAKADFFESVKDRLDAFREKNKDFIKAAEAAKEPVIKRGIYLEGKVGVLEKQFLDMTGTKDLTEAWKNDVFGYRSRWLRKLAANFNPNQ